ncbi:DUF4916 domain-containing protein [Paenibacillus sp.]|uniref:DUF4916 domain-containing protein n=1 Tax=Paenibacillus sp. TaxID=58172 RepID=UPI002D53A791|nr:DUF4916 domain-containing protein [Paenibacillus sp.]HZG84937.1 DUF4916 domain-containing protein [Paenibacillus sp.]
MDWIEEEQWNKIQQQIPIVCVDILAVKEGTSESGRLMLGLILRETPHEGPKYCTVGGRLLYRESLQDGIRRQLEDALGSNIQYKLSSDLQPAYVAQYYPGTAVREGFDAVDPRKHAIGLTYTIEISGEPMPRREALDFKWFTVDELLANEDIGFHQKSVILACMDRLLQISPLESR